VTYRFAVFVRQTDWSWIWCGRGKDESILSALGLILLLRSLSGQIPGLRITDIRFSLLALRVALFLCTLLFILFPLPLSRSFELFFDHLALPLALRFPTSNIFAWESGLRRTV
jgi:hypothetical protein